MSMSYPEAADQEASDGNVGKTQKSILWNGSLDLVDKYAVRDNRVRTGQVDEAVLRITLVTTCWWTLLHFKSMLVVSSLRLSMCTRGRFGD